MSEKTFTESLENLKKAATDISRQATTLEDSLKLYEEGMKEAKYCAEILEKAEQKIETYTREENNE